MERHISAAALVSAFIALVLCLTALALPANFLIIAECGFAALVSAALYGAHYVLTKQRGSAFCAATWFLTGFLNSFVAIAMLLK